MQKAYLNKKTLKTRYYMKRYSVKNFNEILDTILLKYKTHVN